MTAADHQDQFRDLPKRSGLPLSCRRDDEGVARAASLGLVRAMRSRRDGSAFLSRRRNLIQAPCLYIVYEAENRDVLGNEGMLADPPHVFDDAALEISDRQPANEMTAGGSPTMLWIGPCLSIEGGGLEIIFEKIAHHTVTEKLHSAVGVVDNKPLARTQELVRNYK